METHEKKTNDHKNLWLANNQSHKKSKTNSAFQFADKRSETITQRSLHKMANNRVQVKQAVQLQAIANSTVQKQGIEEEEELLQGKFTTIQKQGLEEEELIQGKFEPVQMVKEEEELLQGKFNTIQKQGIDEDELMQGKFEPVQKKENNTGLPDKLKSGIENLSGYLMDDVKVNYNSDKPAQLNAHAYAQGLDIHLAPGQEKHLPHEAWHVVQQKQGRVKPTMQMKGKVNINDDAGLEKEADLMGEKALEKVNNIEQEMQTAQLQTQSIPQDFVQTQESLVQRKLNNTTIEEYKKTLMLNEVSIIELPKDGAKVIDKFSTYPQDSLYNIPDKILGMTLLDVSMPGVEHDFDSLEYYGSVTAYQMVLEMQGGGGFISPFKLAVICEGVSDRALQHEMGHAEQQEALGAQFGGEGTTVNQVILEYHNIMLNENENNDFETVRTHYNSSNLGKHKDKTWENLMSDASKEYPLNATLLKELRYVMDEIFPDEKAEIEKNLISEYYVNVSQK